MPRVHQSGARVAMGCPAFRGSMILHGNNDHLTERIHEAAFEPDLWPGVLQRLAVLTGAARGLLLMADEHGVRDIATSDLTRHTPHERWTARAERMLARARRETRVLTDADLFAAEEPERRPGGADWSAGTAIALPGGGHAIVAVERPHAAFTPEEAQRLDRLRPHLARAVVMAARIGLCRVQAMLDTLATIGTAAAMLTAHGRIRATNAPFDTLDPRIVARVLDRIALPQGDAPIGIPPNDDAPAAVARLASCRDATHGLFANAASLLTITPITTADAPSADLLRSLFDLTAAEARVARGIVAGQSVTAIAAATGISRETVRTQLKAVLAKVGVTRQAELAALLGGAELRPR